jgi:hypothetical protein
MKKRVSVKSNIAGRIFRQSAQNLLTSKNCAVGVFMRRLKSPHFLLHDNSAKHLPPRIPRW